MFRKVSKGIKDLKPPLPTPLQHSLNTGPANSPETRSSERALGRRPALGPRWGPHGRVPNLGSMDFRRKGA
eukprot:932575-Heterocapsa_arctica.AAC.1